MPSRSVVCHPLRPHRLQPPGASVHGILQGRILEWVACPPPGDLPYPVIKPRSPALQADSSPSEPPGKPKNPGVDSQFLLQGIFPTQESNQGLLNCRRITILPINLTPGHIPKENYNFKRYMYPKRNMHARQLKKVHVQQ